LCGLPLLVAPGRLLTMLGWAPIDPILSRILGAALMAFAWLLFRAWQGSPADTRPVLEVQVGFTVLACLGLLRHLLVARYPGLVWALFAVLALLAALAVLFLVTRTSAARR
jgi:hypothetical protein